VPSPHLWLEEDDEEWTQNIMTFKAVCKL
jgi:hypothetical protein